MGQDEKDIYSIIFKVAVKLGKSKEKISFAIHLLQTIEKTDAKAEDFTFCWNLLKEYADIKVEEEDRWSELVDRANEYGKGGKTQRKMVAFVLGEIEDRARSRNE